jgi:hypothetical protein
VSNLLGRLFGSFGSHLASLVAQQEKAHHLHTVSPKSLAINDFPGEGG